MPKNSSNRKALCLPVTYRTIYSVKNNGQKLTVVISIGHGKNRGMPRKSKKPEDVSNVGADSPDWFKTGVEAALTAPTAMNQQKFYLEYNDGNVRAKALLGAYSKMDLGIVKYHFEMATDLKLCPLTKRK